MIPEEGRGQFSPTSLLPSDSANAHMFILVHTLTLVTAFLRRHLEHAHSRCWPEASAGTTGSSASLVPLLLAGSAMEGSNLCAWGGKGLLASSAWETASH